MVKKILSILYAIVILVMAMATFVGQAYGQDYADGAIYGSWWFISLWGLGALLAIVYFLLQKERRGLVILLHVSFIVILVGALITHLTSKTGHMHLRQHVPESMFIDKENNVYQLNFNLTLDTFIVQMEPDGHAPHDFISRITYSNGTKSAKATICMNHIGKQGRFRFYQNSYDDDLQGSTLIVYRDPWGIPVTYAGYVLLFLSLLAMQWKRWKIFLSSVVLAGVIALLFSMKQYDNPILNTWLLPIHVSMIIAAYVLLLVAIFKPRVLLTAVALLTMGIFIGAYWANISWGTYWSWDPKEVWALITLMIYAIPLHRRSFPIFNNPRYYRLYMIFAYLAIIMTYFGVNYFLSGLHSYA